MVWSKEQGFGGQTDIIQLQALLLVSYVTWESYLNLFGPQVSSAIKMKVIPCWVIVKIKWVNEYKVQSI